MVYEVNYAKPEIQRWLIKSQRDLGSACSLRSAVTW